MHLFTLIIVSDFIETIIIEFVSSQLIITIISLIIALIMIATFVPLLEQMKRNRILKYHC